MDQKGPHAKESQREIAATKYAVPNIMLRVIDRAMQVYGSLGYSSDMPLEQMYRTGRDLRVADGADEVHKQTVSRLLLAMQEPKEGYPTEYIPVQKQKARQKFGELIDDVTARV